MEASLLFVASLCVFRHCIANFEYLAVIIIAFSIGTFFPFLTFIDAGLLSSFGRFCFCILLELIDELLCLGDFEFGLFLELRHVPIQLILMLSTWMLLLLLLLVGLLPRLAPRLDLLAPSLHLCLECRLFCFLQSLPSRLFVFHWLLWRCLLLLLLCGRFLL
jgi:hypothetical protein